jgi:hypothetical protein
MILRTAVAVAVMAGLVVVTPAAADPPGLVKVGTTSVASSTDKTITTTCPPGTVVSGGGGYLTAPADPVRGYVSLVRLEPKIDGTGFVSTMREIQPTDEDWRLTTDALCVTAPPNLARIAVTGPLNTQVVTANCGDRNLIGVGGRINNGGGDVIVDYITPSSNLKSVTVRGTRVEGRWPVGWSVTAFAVCADVNGLQLVTSAVPSGVAPHKGVSASCPAGKGLYSVGGSISPGSGQVYLDLVHAISANSFSVAADKAFGEVPLPWALFSHGICG